MGLVVAVLVLAALGLGAPAASAAPFDCKDAPEPQRAEDVSMLAAFDPPGPGRAAPGSAYGEFGYAGLFWEVYDLGCGPAAVRDGAAAFDTTVGSGMFWVAKLLVATTNGLHHKLNDTQQPLLADFDRLITGPGARAMYDSVFLPWIGLALTIFAVVALWIGGRGENAEVAKKAAYALGAVVAAAAVLVPNPVVTSVDTTVATATNQLSQGFVAQLGAGDANTLPTVLYQRVLHDQWVAGEFRSGDAPEAGQLARPLQAAQAFPVGAPPPDQGAIDAKKREFTDLATEERFGPSYASMQGKSGNRTGVGFATLLSAVVIALFQLAAKLVIVAGLLIVRLVLLLMPAIAVVAIVHNPVLPAVFRVAAVALANALFLAVLAGLHTWVVLGLLSPDPGQARTNPLQLLLILLVSVLLWLPARPGYRLRDMMRSTGVQIGAYRRKPHIKLSVRARGDDDSGDNGSGAQRWWHDRPDPAPPRPGPSGPGGPAGPGGPGGPWGPGGPAGPGSPSGGAAAEPLWYAASERVDRPEGAGAPNGSPAPVAGLAPPPHARGAGDTDGATSGDDAGSSGGYAGSAASGAAAGFGLRRGHGAQSADEPDDAETGTDTDTDTSHKAGGSGPRPGGRDAGRLGAGGGDGFPTEIWRPGSSPGERGGFGSLDPDGPGRLPPSRGLPPGRPGPDVTGGRDEQQ